ncbi:MAG: peptide ABC transporter substrate-binding protein [Phycisphaeraceae bacterium]|nr:MAG: peptide ABC transporter substrate-binding protein [Phycisphaeraceae bacterium]
MLRAFVPILLLIVALAISLAGDRPTPRADFTFINRGEVNTLDLQRMSWMQDLRVGRLLFEGLVQQDVFDPDYAIIPAAAESWRVTEDGLVYTFHLRDNLKWSNGKPVRASDFLFAWRRLLLPDTGGDYVRQLQLIRGAEDFTNWRLEALAQAARGDGPTGSELWADTLAKFDELVHARAPDDRTLIVTLDHPAPYFLDLLAMPPFFPVYPPLVSQYERVDPITGRLIIESGWTKPGHIVTNGPFLLKTWRFKRDMRLRANPLHRLYDTLAIRTIAIPTVDDANAMVLAYRSGAADWVTDVVAPYRGDMYQQKLAFIREHQAEYDALKSQGLDEIEIARRLPDDPRNHLHVLPVFGTYFYNFNCSPRLADGRPNPLADARVRRALAMMIDKRAIAEGVRRVGEPVARTLIPPDSLAGYTAPAGLPCISDMHTQADRDTLIAQARSLLAEAGFPDPSKMPAISILFNKDGGHDLIGQSIASDWQRHLGIPVNIDQKELKIFREDLKNKNYMVARAGWYGDYGDATTFLDINRIGDENNDRNYQNPAYDDLLRRASLEPDPRARLDLLQRAEAMLVEVELPFVPLFHYCNIFLFNAHKVSGINAHPRQTQNVYLIDILGDGKGPDTPRSTPPRRNGDAK